MLYNLEYTCYGVVANYSNISDLFGRVADYIIIIISIIAVRLARYWQSLVASLLARRQFQHWSEIDPYFDT